jgi:23S rRNA pseudouridine1911/1915/1917 synthase
MDDNTNTAPYVIDSEDYYIKHSFTADKGQEPMRIDKFLMGRIEGATRNKIQESIDLIHVLVNNKPTKNNYKLKPGDRIDVYETKELEVLDIVPEQMDLHIWYEDDHVLVINKPVGLVVHPASGNYRGTLLNGVAYYLTQQNPNVNAENLPRFGMVHRIDKNTSGLMVLAKTHEAILGLSKQFFDHTIYRRYIALVWGNVEDDEGTIYGHVGRHQRHRKLFAVYPDGSYGKEAITHYRVLERFNYTL